MPKSYKNLDLGFKKKWRPGSGPLLGAAPREKATYPIVRGGIQNHPEWGADGSAGPNAFV